MKIVVLDENTNARVPLVGLNDRGPCSKITVPPSVSNLVDRSHPPSRLELSKSVTLALGCSNAAK